MKILAQQVLKTQVLIRRFSLYSFDFLTQERGY